MNSLRSSRPHRTSRLAGLRRWALASVVAASLALSACGDGNDEPEPASSSDQPAAQDGEPRKIGTFSGSGLRGIEDGHKVTVDGAQGADGFLETLGATPETRTDVVKAIEDANLRDDEILWAAVLGTECLAPKSWTFTQVDGEWKLDVVPDDKAATTTCIAPVTRIGFVAVPKDD